MNPTYRTALIGILILAALGVLAFAFAQRPATAPAKGLPVVASFYPMYYLATEIGGDKVSVTNLTPAGAEPHDYDLTTQDTARLQEAKLVILNGSVETWADKVSSLTNPDATVVFAGNGLLNKELVEEGETMTDPHVWLDPVLMKQEARVVADAFQKVDPANAAYYTGRVQALDQKLDALDTAYRSTLSTCVKKDIVTSHVAFAYLAQRYGLNQVAIAGLSPDQEPSPAELARVADFARTNHVDYIFFESLVSPRLAETIAQEVGAKTLVLDPIEGISDEDAANGANYDSVMRSNLQNLATALQCKV